MSGEWCLAGDQGRQPRGLHHASTSPGLVDVSRRLMQQSGWEGAHPSAAFGGGGLLLTGLRPSEELSARTFVAHPGRLRTTRKGRQRPLDTHQMSQRTGSTRGPGVGVGDGGGGAALTVDFCGFWAFSPSGLVLLPNPRLPRFCLSPFSPRAALTPLPRPHLVSRSPSRCAARHEIHPLAMLRPRPIGPDRDACGRSA